MQCKWLLQLYLISTLFHYSPTEVEKLLKRQFRSLHCSDSVNYLQWHLLALLVFVGVSVFEQLIINPLSKIMAVTFNETFFTTFISLKLLRVDLSVYN